MGEHDPDAPPRRAAEAGQQELTNRGNSMTTTRRTLLKAAAAAPAFALPFPRAFAQVADYPNKPITSIAMFPPGTGADIIVRFYSNKLQEAIGKPVVVENKVGMGGSMAAGYLAQSKPDGYTICLASSGTVLAAAPFLFKNLPYNPKKDFAHVTPVFKAAFVLVVPSTSPYRTVAELTEAMRLKGDKSSYGSATQPGKIASEIYKTQFGLKTVEVPYKSGVDAMNDLHAGQIDFYFTDSGTVREQTRPGGKLRALSTTSQQPIAALPDMPSARQAGIEIDMIAYWAVHVPAQTPKPIIDQLAAWFQPIVASEDARKFLGNLGYDPWIGNAQIVGEMVERESRNWANYSRIARIEPQ
jgi:tripartite-type tricarboxylate transporter receptor subunit TctC